MMNHFGISVGMIWLEIDLPSMIYYILNVTQKTKIGYVGHSQGTMIGFAEFGRPGSLLQNNVSFWAALAPVAHVRTY